MYTVDNKLVQEDKWRISAHDLFCADLIELGKYCQKLRAIFSTL